MLRTTTRTTARAILAASLILGLGALPATASPDRRARDARAATATAAPVRIVDNAFRPKVVTISRGTRVRWTNRGSSVHSVKAAKGSWGSDLLQPGARYSRLFRRAGTFAYYCTVHPIMKGTIVVS